MFLAQAITTETFTTIIIALAVIALVWGLLKRTVWLCVVSLVLGGFLTITRPETWETITSSVTQFFDGAIDPFKTEDKIHDAADDAIGDVDYGETTGDK